jgi:hypothetical protein
MSVNPDSVPCANHRIQLTSIGGYGYVYRDPSQRALSTTDVKDTVPKTTSIQVPARPRRIAHCHLILRGSRWMPVSINRNLGANDRCSPNGAVISALLSAVVEDGAIVGWLQNSGFTVREVQADGSLAPVVLTAARLSVGAKLADAEASRLGAIGITSLLAQRRNQEHNTGHLPPELREAAFERAAIQILDKLQGHPVVGVLLIDC